MAFQHYFTGSIRPTRDIVHVVMGGGTPGWSFRNNPITYGYPYNARGTAFIQPVWLATPAAPEPETNPTDVVGIYRVASSRLAVLPTLFWSPFDGSGPVTVTDTNPSDVINRFTRVSSLKAVVPTLFWRSSDLPPAAVETNPSDSVNRFTQASFRRAIVNTLFWSPFDGNGPVTVVTETNLNDAINRFKVPGYARNPSLLSTTSDSPVTVVVVETGPSDLIAGRFRVTKVNPAVLAQLLLMGQDVTGLNAPAAVVDNNPSQVVTNLFHGRAITPAQIQNLYLSNATHDENAPPPPTGSGGVYIPTYRPRRR